MIDRLINTTNSGEQFQRGDKIGILLDLNEGTLEVSKNGRTIGDGKRVEVNIIVGR